ncbi:hypothetical protein ACVWZA_000786 [Sphingomonas sp. UYAg733]
MARPDPASPIDSPNAMIENDRCRDRDSHRLPGASSCFAADGFARYEFEPRSTDALNQQTRNRADMTRRDTSRFSRSILEKFAWRFQQIPAVFPADSRRISEKAFSRSYRKISNADGSASDALISPIQPCLSNR